MKRVASPFHDVLIIGHSSQAVVAMASSETLRSRIERGKSPACLMIVVARCTVASTGHENIDAKVGEIGSTMSKAILATMELVRIGTTRTFTNGEARASWPKITAPGRATPVEAARLSDKALTMVRFHAR